MSFPRYPKYKDSGVEWISEIPVHWKSIKGHSILREKYETNKGMVSNNLLSLSFGRIVRRDVNTNDGLLPESFETYQVVDPGEIVFRPTDLQNDWNSLRSAIVTERGIITSAYIAVKPRDGSCWFLNYLFRAYDLAKVFYSMGGGLRQAFKFKDIGNLPLIFPPPSEQHAIASFLDRETAKIDALIAEQRRLIELLDEQIKASALCAFTNPDASEYRLEQVCQISSRPVVEEEGSLYTRLGLYNRGRGIFHKDPADPEDLGESDFFWVKKGDLILSGQFAWEGAIAIAGAGEEGCVVSHRYPILRGIPSLALTEFLFALLSTKHGDFLLNEHSRGAAGRNRPLNINSLLKEKIPIPKLQAQSPVAEMFYRRSELLGAIAQQTSLLQERRSALISAAVTGQIDVRGLGPKEAA